MFNIPTGKITLVKQQRLRCTDYSWTHPNYFADFQQDGDVHVIVNPGVIFTVKFIRYSTVKDEVILKVFKKYNPDKQFSHEFKLSINDFNSISWQKV